MTRVSGLLLAAGAGRRMGRPKALLRGTDDTPALVSAVDRLLTGGCEEVVVVLGAEAEQAHALLADAAGRWSPGSVRAVVADDWERGMAASLVTGLAQLAAESRQTPAGPDARAAQPAHDVSASDAVVVLLVDLPDVGAPVVARVVDAWRGAGGDHAAILRAAYDGEPGHPVLLGRDHQAGLAAAVEETLQTEGPADHGARHYLADRQVQLVECGDLASGHDVDRPEDLL